MAVSQQPPYAPGLGDQWQFPGSRRGQAWQSPAPVPEQPVSREEFAQQLRDMEALGVRFPLWAFWFRGRQWTATRYTFERIEAGSAAEIAARLTGGKPAPPERSNPLATGPCPVPLVVERVGQRGSPMPEASGAA